ncbi:TPA: fimbrial protein [Escherichia coli]|uniref:fimbrial protein n=1 Tax=Escherichia coli TaxID=562 RepID=UPI001EBF88DD|nr:fimbrial protein [Escherichia coli]EFI4023940.1 fimbrial protein [Escherichia coli]MDS1597745.1 fimbrial protein [Escherichia coli]HAW1060192.1 fimbrial protein [Escherichia coli]HBK2950696.1 fimbrial protein [Escherichia coli]HEC3577703.1 fimbrial protein [Escherichia coli]
MKMNVITKMVLAAASIAACVAPSAMAGTPSVGLTVNSLITTGTCTMTMDTGSSSGTKTVDFGSVSISEVFTKTKIKTFDLQFSGCAGIPGKKAYLTLAPRMIGCSGPNANLAAFANASPQTPKAAKTAVEVWTTATPNGNGSTQFHCKNLNTIEVDLSSVTTQNPLTYPLSTRMVPVDGAARTELTAGDFYSPTTLTISYQ